MMSGGVCAVWLDRQQSGGICANWWDLGGLVALGGLYIYIYIYIYEGSRRTSRVSTDLGGFQAKSKNIEETLTLLNCFSGGPLAVYRDSREASMRR